jgi:hypothetical protein
MYEKIEIEEIARFFEFPAVEDLLSILFSEDELHDDNAVNIESYIAELSAPV